MFCGSPPLVWARNFSTLLCRTSLCERASATLSMKMRMLLAVAAAETQDDDDRAEREAQPEPLRLRRRLVVAVGGRLLEDGLSHRIPSPSERRKVSSGLAIGVE